MGFWIRKALALGLLGLVGWGVYLEAGWVTAGAVGVILLAVAGLDRRTRAMQGHSFGKMAEMLDGLQNGKSVKLPDEKEGDSDEPA